MFLDTKVEAELQQFDVDDATDLLAAIGPSEPGLVAVARAGVHTLGLQTYFAAGSKESRAWTIRNGDTAPKAVGVIHTDLEKGFVKAEIVSFDDLDAAAAKAAG